MTDEIEKNLRSLQGTLPQGRANLSVVEKDELVRAVGGPLTASSIRKALQSFPRDRIPFLFSSLDPQLVVDIMENDLEDAIKKAMALKKAVKAEFKK